MTTLSLFDGDPFNRILEKVGVYRAGQVRYGPLIVVIVSLGWIIPFILANVEGWLRQSKATELFLRDPTLPVQTLVCIILLFAEPFLDEHIRAGGTIFSSSGLLRDPQKYEHAAKMVARIRHLVLPDLILVVLAYVLTYTWVSPTLQRGMETWGASVHGGSFRFNLSGWWIALVFSPMFQYLWVRWAWKFLIWTLFLTRMARSELRLAVGHPDQVGGLAFLGDIQGLFGILIFAVGLVVATDWINQFLIVRVPGWSLFLNVGAFVLFAPLVFLVPLLMFTKKLYMAKAVGLARYEVLLTRFIHAFEETHLEARANTSALLEETADLADLSCIETLYSNVSKMHIVPFDLISLSRLLGAAVAPMTPLLAQLIPPQVRIFLDSPMWH
jgi:hypothetical protein